MEKDITFIDLFAGIGGFHAGLSKLGMKAVFASEIDKHARETYLLNHKIDVEQFNDDIRAINPDDVPDHTILCAGFPCQPFSQAGHKKGFSDGDKSERGNLFFCILDILEAKRPKAFILENVRHLLKHDDGNTFKRIHDELRAIGYSVNYKIIKASEFGRPQHRPRIYIVGFDEEQVNTSKQFEFPEPIPLKMTMSDVWEGKCERDIGFTLRVGGRGSSIDDRRNWDSYRVDGEVKRLGPLQGKRMQGFPDEFILPKSITQAMKQLGNSVCVDVIENIGVLVKEYLNQNLKCENKDKTMNLAKSFSFNRGEWGEIYTFFKVLTDTQIHFADKYSRKMDEYITVYEVAHNHSDKRYNILNSNLQIKDTSGNTLAESKLEDLLSLQDLNQLLENIKNGSGRAFEIESSVPLLEKFMVENFKGNSYVKGDINLSFKHNGVDAPNDPLGIKSELGAAPTLLNASSATNFIYKIEGFDPNRLNEVNEIETKSKIKDRLSLIQSMGCQLTYMKCEKAVHEENLRLVDSLMPEIIARILLGYYSGHGSKLSQLCETEQESCRVKDYLKAVMLGMFSSRKWDGQYNSNGSILLEKDGELKLFHVIKDGTLKDYLFENTKLDTPSSSRHRFGNVYVENGEYFIKLNLQIRML